MQKYYTIIGVITLWLDSESYTLSKSVILLVPVQ